jgi:hypothetical protein
VSPAEEPDPLTRAGEVLKANGVRLFQLDGVPVVGLWSDLDGPHIRAALAVLENDKLPVRYIDGPNIPMRYKVRKMKGQPVPLEIVAAMDKANADGGQAWEVRDRMLLGIGWCAKVHVYDP